MLPLATIARRSHLDAVAVGYELMGVVGKIVQGGAAVAAVMGAEQERARKRANAAIAMFEIEAKLAKIAYGTRTFEAIPAEAGQTIGELARLYDMTIVLQPDPSKASYDNEIPQQVLFNSGGPMLMVPYIQKEPLDAHHVGIAWDGSRLAARAVRDAMPFLMGAQAVTVVAVNEEAGETSSNQLVAHLGRRGIAARTQRLTADRSDIQGADSLGCGRQPYGPPGDGGIRPFAIAGANSGRCHAQHVRLHDRAGAYVALTGPGGAGNATFRPGQLPGADGRNPASLMQLNVEPDANRYRFGKPANRRLSWHNCLRGPLPAPASRSKMRRRKLSN